MRYFYIGGQMIPKHCIYGPRPREGIIFNDREWFEINDHLYRTERSKQIAEIIAAREQSKKETSLNMTRNWQNTLASIKTQSEQRREEKRERIKQEKIDKYNEILAERKAKKKKLLTDVRNIMFESTDAAKSIASALLQCAVLTEREKQVQFKKCLEIQAMKKEMEYAEKVRKDAEDYMKEMEEEKLKKANKEGRAEYAKLLIEQIKELRKKREEEELKERKAVEKDIMKMKEAEERTRICAERNKKEEEKRWKMSFEKGFHVLELEKRLAMEDEEEEVINKIYLKYARRYAKEKELKEKEMIDEMIAKRDAQREILLSQMQTKESKEQEILEKAIREREEAEERLENEKEAQRLRRQEDMEKWLKDEWMRQEAQWEMRKEAQKWAILQQYRRLEHDAEWEAAMIERKKQAIIANRDFYAKQIAEKAAAEAERIEEEQAFLEDKNRDRILKYCQDAIDYTNRHGWVKVPLLHTVSRIRRELGADDDAEAAEPPRGRAVRPTGGPLGSACYCFRN